MISICTRTIDLAGDILLEEMPGSAAQTYQRRISVTATLDGLSTIADMGYTASDNVFGLKFEDISNAQIERLQYLISNYAVLTLANNDGVFVGALNNLISNRAPVECQFLVSEKLTG
jgi:hypothetical protein